MALGGGTASGRGVDSAHASHAALEAARRLALETGAAVAVTGAVDLVTDGTAVLSIANGVAMMTRITGMGCTATALIGACLGAGVPALQAAAHALVLLGLAAEHAEPRARGPASLQVELLDALYRLDTAGIRAGMRLTDGTG
jgi:hydroxyethylthiazole kinase